MAKHVSKMTPPEIKALEREIAAFVEQPSTGKTRALRLGIEQGLYIIVDKRGANSAAWQYRYMHRGKSRSAGLGPWPTVTPKRAAEKADAMRAQLKGDRVDPLAVRQAEDAKGRAEAAKNKSFKDVAEAYIQSHHTAWRSGKHLDQWRSTMAQYVFPIVGSLPVRDIDVDLVKRVLTQDVDGVRLWDKMPVTGSRLRARLEAVLGYAGAEGLRSADANPARWRGGLEHQLPAPGKVHKSEGHAALPWQDLPGFMAKLRALPGVAARALEIGMLCAVRAGEVRFARVGEFDLDQKVWTIPAERTKSHQLHVVPLVDHAVDILRSIIPADANAADLVFTLNGRRLPEDKMRKALWSIGDATLTVHGTCRATFRSWAAAQGVAHDLAEAALSHTLKDTTVAAYQRDAMLERRRHLAEAYARWCAGLGGKVIELASLSA